MILKDSFEGKIEREFMELLKINNRSDLNNLYQNIDESCFIAVEGLIFDNAGYWILHRRGPGCRDEQYKLEGIGGSIAKGEDFHHALKREIIEEVGTLAKVDIIGVMEVRKDTVFDRRLNRTVTWIIVSFLCKYSNGELLRMEPDKNLGYEKFHITKIPQDELSSSSRSAYLTLKRNWEDIKDILKVTG